MVWIPNGAFLIPMSTAGREEVRAYGCTHRLVSAGRNLTLLAATTLGPICSTFQAHAGRCSSTAWTFNPKVAGSNPARPMRFAGKLGKLKAGCAYVFAYAHPQFRASACRTFSVPCGSLQLVRGILRPIAGPPDDRLELGPRPTRGRRPLPSSHLPLPSSPAHSAVSLAPSTTAGGPSIHPGIAPCPVAHPVGSTPAAWTRPRPPAQSAFTPFATSQMPKPKPRTT
jgi:hypothetical protein